MKKNVENVNLNSFLTFFFCIIEKVITKSKK